MTVQIYNYSKDEAKGSLVATFDAYLPNIQLTLRNLRLVHGKKGFYVAYPAKGIGDIENKKFVSYFEWGADRDRDFKAKLMSALAPQIAAEGSRGVEQARAESDPFSQPIFPPMPEISF